MIKISIESKSECCNASFTWITCDECENSGEDHEIKKCSECWETVED